MAEVVDFPRYDEYNDDYEVDFSDQAVGCSKLENVPFEQSHCYNNEYEENCKSTEGNSRHLCFASFELLK
jgi:hypothetical protein